MARTASFYFCVFFYETQKHSVQEWSAAVGTCNARNVAAVTCTRRKTFSQWLL